MHTDCLIGSSRRPWTQEEKVTYLDFHNEEDRCVEEEVRK